MQIDSEGHKVNNHHNSQHRVTLFISTKKKKKKKTKNTWHVKNMLRHFSFFYVRKMVLKTPGWPPTGGKTKKKYKKKKNKHTNHKQKNFMFSTLLFYLIFTATKKSPRHKIQRRRREA